MYFLRLNVLKNWQTAHFAYSASFVIVEYFSLLVFQFIFDVFYAWESLRNLFRVQFRQFIRRNSQWLSLILFHGPLRQKIIFFFADEQSYCVIVILAFYQMIDSRTIKIQFTDELRLKFDRLQFTNSHTIYLFNLIW